MGSMCKPFRGGITAITLQYHPIASRQLPDRPACTQHTSPLVAAHIWYPSRPAVNW